VGSITDVTEPLAVSVFRIEVIMYLRDAARSSTLKCRVLSVLRGNFTVPRNAVNENKKIFQFPINGLDGRATITHVLSFDKSGSTYGAVAYIISGGVGYKRVSLGYNLRANYGVDHAVEIYGL
jgi:hypothetical protein